MQRRASRIFSCVRRSVEYFIFLIIGILSLLDACTTQPPLIRVGPKALRALVVSSTPITYPDASARAHVSGPVVVEIEVGAGGKVASSKLLQSPDVLTGRAVIDGVRRWRFAAPHDTSGRAVRLTSRLVFYFTQADGEAKVLDAQARRPEQAGE